MSKKMIYRLYADRGPMVAVKEEGFFWRHCRGKSERGRWKPPEPYIFDHKSQPLVDMLSGHPGVYFVSEKFKQKMKSLLDNYVEFLPLGDIKGKPYYVLNVITVIDCLDRSKSKIRYSLSTPRVIRGVDQYVFKDIPIKAPIFKVPEDLNDIFVTEQFTNEVLKNGITGVGVDKPDDIRLAKTNDVLEGFPT